MLNKITTNYNKTQLKLYHMELGLEMFQWNEVNESMHPRALLSFPVVYVYVFPLIFSTDFPGRALQWKSGSSPILWCAIFQTQFSIFIIPSLEVKMRKCIFEKLRRKQKIN